MKQIETNTTILENNKIPFLGIRSKIISKKRLINICDIEELSYLMHSSQKFTKQK